MFGTPGKSEWIRGITKFQFYENYGKKKFLEMGTNLII